MRGLEQSIRKRRLAVIDVRDDAEIADVVGLHGESVWLSAVGPDLPCVRGARTIGGPEEAEKLTARGGEPEPWGSPAQVWCPARRGLQFREGGPAGRDRTVGRGSEERGGEERGSACLGSLARGGGAERADGVDGVARGRAGAGLALGRFVAGRLFPPALGADERGVVCGRTPVDVWGAVRDGVEGRDGAGVACGSRSGAGRADGALGGTL
jgi:hypothetical protein